MLGIPVDNVDMDQALTRIMGMVDQHQFDARKRLVATANVDFIINAHDHAEQERGRELLSILRKADMVTADGMPLVWLSKLMGQPLQERVTGADMVPALAERAAAEGKSIYLFGGIDGSAKETARILVERYPDLKIAGYSNPFINLDDKIENKIEIARINITDPDILLIALGNPKQEIWFDRYKKYLKVPVSIGIGGTFEFISGVTSRAPLWMQRSGLEWIYRMSQDPARLVNRYIKGLYRFNRMILPLLTLGPLVNWLRNRKTTVGEGSMPIPYKAIPEVIAYHLEQIEGIQAKAREMDDAVVLELDFSQIPALKTEDISQLMSILLVAMQSDRGIVLTGLNWVSRQLIKAYRIDDLVSLVAQPEDHATERSN